MYRAFDQDNETVHILLSLLYILYNCLCSSVAEFSIWTREAGAGGLSIAVEGPSKAEITFEDRKDGSCGVAYVVQEPGQTDILYTLNECNVHNHILDIFYT